VNVDRDTAPSTEVDWHQRMMSNGRVDADVFGIDEIDSRVVGTNVPSRGSLGLLDTTADTRKFHDLTSYSRGLLTNAAAGHWKRDFSIFSEQYDDLPDFDDAGEAPNQLPAFMFNPGDVFNINKAVNSTRHADQPPHAIIYPWTNYRNIPRNTGWAQIPAVCSWTSITEYARQYQYLNTNSSTRTSMDSHFASYNTGDRFEFQELVRRTPVIARIDWVLSLCSEEIGNSGQYRAGVMITPVLSMWNPYNVELTTPRFVARIRKGGLAPLEFSFRAGNETGDFVAMEDLLGDGSTSRSNMELLINEPFTLGPGETRAFSMNNTSKLNVEDIRRVDAPGNGDSRQVIVTPGFTKGAGMRSYNLNATGATRELIVSGNETFGIDQIKYTREREGDISFWMDMGLDDDNLLAVRMGYREGELASHTDGAQDGKFAGLDVLTTLYPTLEDRKSEVVSLVSDTNDTLGNGLNTVPFAGVTFGMKFTTPFRGDDTHDRLDSSGNPVLDASGNPIQNHSHLRTKGLLQAHPLTYYSEVGNQDDGVRHNNMQDCGVFHPVNAPYDFNFFDVDGWGDGDNLPQTSDENEAYIISGLTPTDGVTRCVLIDLLTRPLQSLAQLQHFDIRNNNPFPPFQLNLIGNSHAHPLFDPDQVSIDVTLSQNVDFINDDSYLLNHILFDDWFVSSIAPDLADFGKNETRSLQQVYDDHINNVEPLPNRFYVAARGASLSTVDSGNQPDGLFTYEVIAAELEIEGAFNVNSVSLDAWKAILRHSAGNSVPYIDDTGETVLDTSSNYPYSRTSIAGDRLTSSGPSAISSALVNGAIANGDAVKITGAPDLTESQIDALAEEIVKEVRERGPFLSLSEFVNRQLSNDKDLAYAGTIAKALNTLSQSSSSSENPFLDIQNLFPVVTNEPFGDHDFGFPEAALGSAGFGVPGWIRQADILTPLAPIMTVRDDSFTIRAYGDFRDENDNILEESMK